MSFNNVLSTLSIIAIIPHLSDLKNYLSEVVKYTMKSKELGSFEYHGNVFC